MTRRRRIVLALGANVALVCAEAAGGFAAHSTALMADAGHNLTDVAALALSLYTVTLAMRSPTVHRSYGYHRATILAALANVVALLIVTVLIAIGSVERLVHPVHADGALVVPIALAATLVNALGAGLLLEHRHDLNMRTAALHLAGDTLASLAVVGAGTVDLVTTRAPQVDPAVSLAIALLIALEAVRLARAAIDVLLESVPADVDPVELADVIALVPGVFAVHHVHCWSLSSEIRALSAHVVLSGEPTLEEAHAVAELIKTVLVRRFNIGHATLELEAEPCEEGGSEICTIEFPEGA